LHTPTNFLLLSLAVSDLLVGFLSMPGEIYRHTTCWFLGDTICFLYNYLCVVTTSASVGDMVLISIDRYMAICDPLHYQTRVTERRVKVCVCLCWLCSVVYSIVFIKDDLIKTGWNNSCYGECVTVVDVITATFDLVIIFIAPVTIIIVLYMRVFVVAVSQARAMRSQVTAIKMQLSVTTTANKSELKAARTLGVLVLVFLLCFCPYYCLSLAAEDSFSSSTMFTLYYLFYFNSSLNPMIYALFYPWFRKTVKLMVTLKIL
uniref:G-protein coupled receptors family 1 profile domain-containing protein n=1 Tax=Fundulus heteroclitus TaxID=8078 RepID=A0A3Q2Q3D2_FUNHE